MSDGPSNLPRVATHGGESHLDPPAEHGLNGPYDDGRTGKLVEDQVVELDVVPEPEPKG